MFTKVLATILPFKFFEYLVEVCVNMPEFDEFWRRKLEKFSYATFFCFDLVWWPDSIETFHSIPNVLSAFEYPLLTDLLQKSIPFILSVRKYQNSPNIELLQIDKQIPMLFFPFPILNPKERNLKKSWGMKVF